MLYFRSKVTLSGGFMEINEDKLYDDLIELRRILLRNQSINNIRKYYPIYSQLNYVLAQLTGYCFEPNDVIYRNMDKLNENIRLRNKKQLLEYFDRTIREGDSLYFLYMSFNDILKESNYIQIFNRNIPTYNEAQAKNMILTYFKQFGDKIYSIAESYINNRVSTDVELEPGVGGSFYNNYSNELGYILIQYDKFDASSISAIVHEIGHAIDNSLFVYPQQKNLTVSSQFLVEVPSTFFELNFLQYLIENNIDVKGASYCLADRIFLIKRLGEEYEKFYNLKNVILTEDRCIIDTKTEEYVDLEGAILYGHGYLYSLNLCELYKEDKDLAIKKLINLICSRKEMTILEGIESLGFDEDEFLSLKRPKEGIKKFIKKYNEGFNIYE